MTLDTSHFLFKDTVPEPRLELSASSRGGGHAHGILSTADNDLEVAGHSVLKTATKIRRQTATYVGTDGSDASAVQGGLGGEGLQHLEVFGVVELQIRNRQYHRFYGWLHSLRQLTLAVLSLLEVMK
jgi:hypothetical protein